MANHFLLAMFLNHQQDQTVVGNGHKSLLKMILLILRYECEIISFYYFLKFNKASVWKHRGLPKTAYLLITLLSYRFYSYKISCSIKLNCIFCIVGFNNHTVSLYDAIYCN